MKSTVKYFVKYLLVKVDTLDSRIPGRVITRESIHKILSDIPAV